MRAKCVFLWDYVKNVECDCAGRVSDVVRLSGTTAIRDAKCVRAESYYRRIFVVPRNQCPLFTDKLFALYVIFMTT
jgi:hypothetical protein